MDRGVVVAALRFFALLLASLTLGLSFSHVMEMQAKLDYPPELYATVNNTLYRAYGAWAALLEPAKLVVCAALCVAVRKRKHVFTWTVIATISFLTALVIWLAVVWPVNQANLAAFNAGGHEASVRAWADHRLRWEVGHAASFAFQLLGLCALLLSLFLGERTFRAPPRMAERGA